MALQKYTTSECELNLTVGVLLEPEDCHQIGADTNQMKRGKAQSERLGHCKYTASHYKVITN